MGGAGTGCGGREKRCALRGKGGGACIDITGHDCGFMSEAWENRSGRGPRSGRGCTMQNGDGGGDNEDDGEDDGEHRQTGSATGTAAQRGQQPAQAYRRHSHVTVTHLTPRPSIMRQLSLYYTAIRYMCRRTAAIWKSQPPRMYFISSSRRISLQPPVPATLTFFASFMSDTT